jgi:N-acetylglucosamine kinase-like BadF-type ATPase
MRLIVDSGSTKSDWVLVEGDVRRDFTTPGLNPVFHTEESVAAVVMADPDLFQFASEVKELFFYGAGCSSESMKSIIQKGLQRIFTYAEISVDHDLAACAYATFTGEPAIACILGTGSNSCFYDGNKISRAMPALGYILGDEGSGSYLGKRLLSDYLYQRVPHFLSERLSKEAQLDKDGIVELVYRKPNANVFLASMTSHLFAFRDEEYVKQMVTDGFRKFIDIHITAYPDFSNIPVHFVGSVAYLFRDQLEKACAEFNIKPGNILQKPMDGLVLFHQR